MNPASLPSLASAHAAPMPRSVWPRLLACALLLPALACNLLDVSSTENLADGRGARVFDPYQSTNSGAIGLSLQQYNGCGVLPTGQTVPKNTVIPDSANYPDTCASPMLVDGLPPPQIPDGTLKIAANTTYFLNQFTITDTVTGRHTDPRDMASVVRWLKTESRFKKLDWSNVGQVVDEWLFYTGSQGVSQDSWTRRVLFDNANWRTAKDDTFEVQILDQEGTPRLSTPIKYARSEFLVDTPYAGHSHFGWRMENVAAPRSPGDNDVNPVPQFPGMPPQLPVFRTLARLDLVGSTNPFKTFRVPDLRGPGAMKITWSQLPDDPFYFPVTFVSKEEQAPTCLDAAGTSSVTCSFGVDPNLRFTPAANGQYFVPGETVNMTIDVRDDQGNRLHSPDLFPSGQESVSGQTNGLLYTAIPYIERTLEEDMIPVVTVAGPLDKMTPRSNPNEPAAFFGDTYTYSVVSETATTTLGTGESPQQWSTRYQRILPQNAQPGTYVAFVKFNRFFAGERVAKMKAYFFQVGTNERTTYPNRVGNCQICHKGVNSLDNVRHGLPVDHVEGCKACHQYETSRGGRIANLIHNIHSHSPKFSAERNDCKVCHIARESATRPSLDTCGSCHPSAHGDEYFASKFTAKGEPSRFGNCAESCHQLNPPKLHMLPEN